jgi:hypothetical protein
MAGLGDEAVNKTRFLSLCSRRFQRLHSDNGTEKNPQSTGRTGLREKVDGPGSHERNAGAVERAGGHAEPREEEEGRDHVF